jgi:hypothetical protein
MKTEIAKEMSIRVPTKEDLAQTEIDKVLIFELKGKANITMGITRDQLRVITQDLVRFCQVLAQEEELLITTGIDFEQEDDDEENDSIEKSANISLRIFPDKLKQKLRNLPYFS